jgi:hypothetical protein
MAKADVTVKSSILIILLLFAFTAKAEIPIEGNYTLWGGFDTNPLIMNSPESSGIVVNSLKLGYYPEYSGFDILYQTQIFSIINFPERNYNLHQIKTDYKIQPLNYEYFELNFAASGLLRNNSSGGNLYDYSIVNAGIGGTLYSDIGIISVLYTPEYSNFSNYSRLSSFTNEIFLQLDKTFESETQLKIELSYLSKNYFNSSDNDDEISIDKRYKRFPQNNPKIQQPNSVSFSNINEIIDLDFGINHTFTEYLLLGLGGNINKQLSKDGFYFASGTTDVLTRNEFIDNSSNFEEKAVWSLLNLQLFEDFGIDFFYRYNSREFLYTLNLISEIYSDKIYRVDTANNFNIKLNYVIFEDYEYIKQFTTNLTFDYFNNNSNSMEYTFESFGVFISADVRF